MLWDILESEENIHLFVVHERGQFGTRYLLASMGQEASEQYIGSTLILKHNISILQL